MTVDYRSARAGHHVNVQLSIISRKDRTREQIETAIDRRLRTGRNPKHYKLKITAWRGQEQAEHRTDLWNALRNFADDSEKDHEGARTLDPTELRDWEDQGEDDE